MDMGIQMGIFQNKYKNFDRETYLSSHGQSEKGVIFSISLCSLLICSVYLSSVILRGSEALGILLDILKYKYFI